MTEEQFERHQRQMINIADSLAIIQIILFCLQITTCLGNCK